MKTIKVVVFDEVFTLFHFSIRKIFLDIDSTALIGNGLETGKLKST